MLDEPMDRHRPRLETLAAAILQDPGVLPPEVRRTAAFNEGVPDPFADYVDTIHRHAYRVTDERVSNLSESGTDDDAVFEISIASAYGAARMRLDAGLEALRAARDGT